MHDTTPKDMLTDLGRRLVNGSLSDAALQQATEQTPNFAILPWVNVVKIGGQSIMDRGRVAVRPVVDEIVANLDRHKMILGTGAGTRARHVYSLAIDLGLPTASSRCSAPRSRGRTRNCCNTSWRSTASRSSSRKASRRCRIT